MPLLPKLNRDSLKDATRLLLTGGKNKQGMLSRLAVDHFLVSVPRREGGWLARGLRSRTFISHCLFLIYLRIGLILQSPFPESAGLPRSAVARTAVPGPVDLSVPQAWRLALQAEGGL